MCNLMELRDFCFQRSKTLKPSYADYIKSYIKFTFDGKTELFIEIDKIIKKAKFITLVKCFKKEKKTMKLLS